MRKFTVAIIDDEKEARVLLQKMLSKYEFVDITLVSGNVEDTIHSIVKSPPDLIFLDIHMPGKDGFELIREMEKMRIQSKVVFVTAYNSYAIKAIKVNAFDYLLKPIDPDELDGTLVRYRQMEVENEHFRNLKETIESFRIPRRVKLITDQGFVIVNTRNVIYMHYQNGKVHFFITNGKREIVNTTLTEILDKFPKGGFIQIDSSTVVNSEFITRVNLKQKQCELTVDESKFELSVAEEKLPEMEKLLGENLY